jgi:hypothetical protein
MSSPTPIITKPPKKPQQVASAKTKPTPKKKG